MQLVASSAIDCCWMTVTLSRQTDSSNWTSAVDIGIGASGSELVLINDLLCVYNFASSNGANSVTYSGPISIPAGSRISARSSAGAGSSVINVSLQLFDGAFTMMEGCGGWDGIGVSTARSFPEGTLVDPGATVNTKGAYAQLVASTSRDYCGLNIQFDEGVASAPAANTIYLVDIAIGASGSENAIIPNASILKLVASSTFRIIIPGVVGPYFVPIPAGSRISARAQSSDNGASTRPIGVSVYGFWQ